MLVACQTDARLRNLSTEVLSCQPVEGGFIVRTADTVLYPEGGGQPADRGRIGGVDVTDVQMDAQGPWHRTAEPVALGPTTIEVDWRRRFDHMQQHTAQHLLTAIAQDRLGWATTSFHLHPLTDSDVPACDIELDASAVSVQELALLEREVNAAIRANHAIVVREVDRVAYEALDVRSRGVPDGVERIRLVGIDGIDLNTCGGTHVAHLAELQQVVLLGTEKIRGGTRLFYVAGARVTERFARMLGREKQLSRLLSEGPSSHVQAVTRLADRGKAASKKVRALQLELARWTGKQLFSMEGPLVVHFAESADPAFLNAVVNHATFANDPRVFLLTGGREGAGPFLIRGPAEMVTASRPAVLDLLEARGGGPPGRLQGQAARLEGGPAVADWFRQALADPGSPG